MLQLYNRPLCTKQGQPNAKSFLEKKKQERRLKKYNILFTGKKV
jgi:hypothetical protein